MKKLNVFQKGLVVEIISALLILLFFYTGISKLYDVPDFQRVLRGSPLIGNFAPLVSWAIPISELLVCSFLFFRKTRRIGLYISVLLMSVFTLYIGYMIAFTPNLPCSCGGVISKMSWNQHLIFNVLFSLLALLGLLVDKRNSRISPERLVKNNNSPALS